MLSRAASEPFPRKTRWMVALVIFGIALRLLRYALDLPMWMDESLLGVNILDRPFSRLAQPMQYVQIAPIGFLYAERAMYQCFGMSEFAMRLLPTLAGIAGLILFAFWTRRILDPLAAIVATGVLAISDLAIRHAVEFKPYGFDLLMAIVLMMLASQYLLQRRRRWLILLIPLTPVALIMSLPAIFVAAGVFVTLLLSSRRIIWTDRLLIAIYGLLTASVFLLLFHRVIGTQFHGAGGEQLPLWSWPPYQPIAFLRWFIHSHADNFFGYPLDVSYPWAGVSFALFCFGAVQLLRNRCGMIAALLLLPFLMNFAAAMLRLYPYADSPRVGQHLAPAICLLIGVGIAELIRICCRTVAARRSVLALLLIGALILGISGPLAIIFRPTSALRADRAARRYVRELLARIPSDATIAVLQPPDESAVIVRWYLHEWPGNIVWNAHVSELLRETFKPIWFISTVPNAESEADIDRQAGGSPSAVEHARFGSDDDGCCDVFVFHAAGR